MQQKTVLLTGAGAPGMPGILTCLKGEGYRLIGMDMSEHASCRKEFEAFYVGLPARDPGFLARVEEICQKEKVDLVFPCVTAELEALSLKREAFLQKGVRIAVMEADKITLANDKGLLLNFIRDQGLPTPEFTLLENTAALKEAVRQSPRFSTEGFCVKAVTGNGSRGVRLCDPKMDAAKLFFMTKPNSLHMSPEALYDLLEKAEPWPKKLILMELLPGDEYSVDIVAGQGRVLAQVCRVGLSVSSGNQTLSRVVDRPDILKVCSEVVKAGGFSGNLGFDLKCDAQGRPYIIECNPRLTGGIVVCLAAGANMPRLGLEYWQGMEVTQPAVRVGVSMERFWNERFYDENDQLMDIARKKDA